jgi:two-component system sensor histidine kinase QseC
MTQALAGVDRSTRLVEQMLRLARLDPLARLPGSTKIDLAELAQDVAAGVRDSVPEARIDLRLDENTPPVDGDADLLSIALRNLIDNALRYSPPGSIVAVELGRHDGARLLCVSDNGPGVSDEDLPRLVERFYRGSEVNAEGSGLGLTIVHRIAELHGAKLELSNRDGGGFQARLRWPT